MNAVIRSLLVVSLSLVLGISEATEIGFDEIFSLTADRDDALKQLIPGTDDHYYYRCIHLQNQGELDRAEQLVREWEKNRRRQLPQILEIKYRQALLRYESSPDTSLDFIRERLGLHFDHQKDTVAVAKTKAVATTLDPASISRDAYWEAAHRQHGGVAGVEDSGLDWLAGRNLGPDQRRRFLQRLRRPDLPDLPMLVVDDLKHRRSRGFGSMPIHRLLTLDQLKTCLELRPDLIRDGKFVNVWLTKLLPREHVDLTTDAAARIAHLERLWSFVSTLPPVHNSLRASTLYHRLLHDRDHGIYDRERFMSYLKLPRNVTYINQDYLKQRRFKNQRVNLSANYHGYTSLPPVNSDEELVRDYLAHFFLDDDGYLGFADYVDDEYLKTLFAETKLVNGLGDPEDWYAMLAPGALKQLRTRIDLDFSPTNATHFDVADKVTLGIFVKNVKTLIVNVYELNELNYHQTNGQEIGTDINLDGLVANYSNVYEYEDAPIRRVRRDFDFPQLNHRGVFIVEFIGNGKSSRALIRKGTLRFTERQSTAGHVLTVFNEQNQRVVGAQVHLGTQHYTTDDAGEIVVPYSTNAGDRTLIIAHNNFSVIRPFRHAAESYTLEAGFHVEREALIKRSPATLLVRAGLAVNGIPVTLAVLDRVRLSIISTDHDGIQSTAEVAPFKLAEDAESEHTFQVPDRLSTIEFVLRAQVKGLSTGNDIDLVARRQFVINGIDHTERVAALNLGVNENGWYIDVRGKSGEPRASQAVSLDIKHREFRNPIHRLLQSDERGRIYLGQCDGVQYIHATAPDSQQYRWPLSMDAAVYPPVIHTTVGNIVRLPYFGQATTPTRDEMALLERNRSGYVADRFSALRIVDGYVECDDLAAGDYEFVSKHGGLHTVTIRIAADAVQQADVIFSAHQQLDHDDAPQLHVRSITTTGGTVNVQLGGYTPFSRIHIVATRFLPPFPIFDNLNALSTRILQARSIRPVVSTYLSGRDIGDEYRYIIDRQYAQKFPGNTLQRPGILLNPWVINDTTTGTQHAGDGQDWQRAAEPPSTNGVGGNRMVKGGPGPGGYTAFSNLDFLPRGAVTVTNLRPDDRGVVTLELDQLGDGRQLHVIAVSPRQTSYRFHTLAETELSRRDLRLANAVSPDRHVARKKAITVVQTGEKFEIGDVGSARFENYDTLARVYGLLRTLSADTTLADFDFVTKWPTLSDSDKRDQYGKFACHELNFFIFRKDPDFFERVVQPYIRNKREKTFLDHWLLGDALDAYLQPWAYARLNVVERILLAQRQPNERSETARHVADLYNLIPPDIDRLNRLFDTAIQGKALDVGDPLSFRQAKAASNTAKRLAQRAKNGRGGRAVREIQAMAMSANADDFALDVAEEAAPSMIAGRAMHKGGAVAASDAPRAFFANDREREQLRPLYRQMDTTKEWAETNYYHLPIEKHTADRVTVNAFWRDFAAHGEGPFFSTNVAEASGNFTEMMFALSVLDLPFSAEPHQSATNAARFTITAGSPTIVFHEQIADVDAADDGRPILVSQNFFKHNDRYRQVNNQRFDKYVTDEFLVHTVYGCHVVVTNPSSSPQKLDLLLQVPLGAIPVLKSRYTTSVHLELKPYNTTSIEYYFYFPKTGQFHHYPVHVSREEQLVAFATPVVLNVVETLSTFDRTSWEYVSQNGSNDDVIAYLNEHNVHGLELKRIAFRMRDAAFFKRVIDVLEQRHRYDDTLWSYGIYHNDTNIIRAYLPHQQGFIRHCGEYIDTPILQLDPVERRTYQHLEYSPLVNARAHQLGKARQILNRRFVDQYRRLLHVLRYRPVLSDADSMAIVYYLLLQDRVGDALARFATIKPAALTTTLQYDYLKAYMAFYTGDIADARALGERYRDYPVPRWRNRFRDVLAQLDEIDGKEPVITDDENREQQQTTLAAAEASLEFSVENQTIRIDYQNVERVQVNYYLMDIELLFSRNPFVKQQTGHFAYIQPNETQSMALDSATNHVEFPLPKAFHSSNVLVEVVGAGVRKSAPYYANTMRLHVVENYGHVSVATHDGKPLSTVYVKVYGKMSDGSVRFYKDGYTDLRGRFDYSSLNTNDLDHVSRFALLVISDEHGAVIREVAPPQR